MTAPNRNTAVATIEPPAPAYALSTQVGKILTSDDARALIMPLIPHGVDFEHVIAEVHRAAVNEPKILKCTPASIINAVATVVQTGLTVGKTIHLVPLYNKDKGVTELNAWNDYKGDIELVMWSGVARFVDAKAVYEHDHFDYRLGDNPMVDHKPVFDASKRGPIIGGYFVAWLDRYGRIKKVVVMPLADIEKIRKGSKQWNPEKVRDCPDWYVEKTLIHRGCKTLPKNPRLAAVMAMLDAREQADTDSDLDPANEVQSPASAAKVDGLPAGFMFAPKEEDAPSTTPAPTLSAAARFPMPFRSSKGDGAQLDAFTNDELAQARVKAQRMGGYDEFLTMSETFLAEREQAIRSDQALKDEDDDLPF